jgi:serine phosphatase RsbU (regulator of sigma subunit)
MNEPSALPESTPAPSSAWSLYGVRLSARIMAADGAICGGDWCEAFALSQGVIALSIGDVCGHGDDKFATRVAIRQSIRDAARLGLDPAQTLVAAHYYLRATDPDEYATAIFGLLSVEKRTFEFANAGHPPPLTCGPAGTAFLEYSKTDLPLGLEEMTVPALHTVAVPEGTLVVLYTDGVTEHDRKPLDGASELCDAATFAYNFPKMPIASLIEQQMDLDDGNYDDAAILTAWTPRRFRRMSTFASRLVK